MAQLEPTPKMVASSQKLTCTKLSAAVNSRGHTAFPSCCRGPDRATWPARSQAAGSRAAGLLAAPGKSGSWMNNPAAQGCSARPQIVMTEIQTRSSPLSFQMQAVQLRHPPQVED